MKKLFFTILILVTFCGAPAHAGNMKLQEIKSLYMRSCLQSGGVKEICLCSFDRARETMSPVDLEDAIRALNAKVPAKDEALMKMNLAAQYCAKKTTAAPSIPTPIDPSQITTDIAPPPPPPPPSVDPIAVPKMSGLDDKADEISNDLSIDYLATQPNPAKDAPVKLKKKKISPEPIKIKEAKPKYFGQYDAQVFEATKKGDLTALRALGQALPSFEIKDKAGNTPLMISVIYGNNISMNFLLENGASPNAKTPLEQTVLHLASFARRPDITENLLQYGADPNVAYGSGYTPLILAVMKQDDLTVNAILKYRAKPDAALNNGNTAMHIAATGQNMKVISWLVTYGAKVDALNKEGYTPLMLAAYNGNIAAVQTLLGYRADAAKKDKYGRAAAALAYAAGHYDIANMLGMR